MKVLKSFQLSEKTQLQLVDDGKEYIVKLVPCERVLSREDDYDRACESFESWKNYWK